MSSQAGSTNLPADSPKTGGLDSSRISTNEQGVVLRYFAGIGRFSLTWLGPAYNQVAKAVKSSSGGKGDTGASSSHKYYADCAGLLCVGLVDTVHEIWMQNEKVWDGPLARTAGADSAEITIENKGTLKIYWGTETQPIDPILSAYEHPAYRGQCYVVFNKLYFGQDTTSAPNVEFVLSRTPQNTGLATDVTLNDDVVAAHAMIELLADERFGLGWVVADTLDLAAWDTAATQMRGEGIAISPILDREQDARTLMVQFCDYFDGYLVAEPANAGKLVLRLARPFAGDATTLPLLGEYELLDVPNPSSQNWRETFNEFSVKYTDQSSDYQNNSTLFIDPANRRAVGEPLPTTLDRPWITKKTLAKQVATYAARLQAVPWVTAKDIHVRKEAAASIEPGDFVRLTYADYLETIIMRVMSRKVEADRSQEVQFELRADGYYNEILAYTPDLPPAPDRPIIHPQPPAFERILELPFGLVPHRDDRTQPQVAALVARESGLDVRYRVFTSEDDTTYRQDAHSRRFCIYGTLGAALPITHTLDDGADGMEIDFTGPDDALDLDTTTRRGWLKQRLLIFIENEIISYRDVEILSPTSARLTGLRRGCYDTLTAVHATGTPVAIIARSDLHVFTDATYEKGETVYFKVATATAKAMLDLGGIASTALTLAHRTARPLCPINLRVNGSGFTPQYSAGDDFQIDWDITSWQRHNFWESWDQPFEDSRIEHRVQICQDGGTNVASYPCASGISTYLLANSVFQALFGGSEPAAFLVRVLSRRRGFRSFVRLELRVVKV